MKKYYSIFFLIIVCIFFLPTSVFAYTYIKDECIDNEKCMLVCNYAVTYLGPKKGDYGGIHGNVENTGIISIFYMYNNTWKFVWGKSSNVKEATSREGSYSSVVSKNIYFQQKLDPENFTCPDYGYLDFSTLWDMNELCFDNDGTTCAEEYSNWGTSFGKDSSLFVSSKKDYDVFNDIYEYLTTWHYGDMSCDELRAKKDAIKTETIHKLKNDFQVNFLHGNIVPTFIQNNEIYNKKETTILTSLEEKIQNCKEEIDSKKEQNEITEAEASKQKEEFDNIDREQVQEGIKDGFSAMETLDISINTDHLNQEQKCEGIFGTVDGDGNFQKETFGWLLQKILNYIKIAGPILTILFSMFEFIKAIASSDEESMKKVQSRLVVRIIAVVALFLVPWIVGEALKLINGISNPTCFFK